MTYSNAFENDIPSDLLDAMADLACEQREAMTECEPTDFQLVHHDTNNKLAT